MFIVFCRVGGCLMTMPGFSSPRLTLNIRIFLALAVSLAMSPMLMPFVYPVISTASHSTILLTVATEVLIGGLIGFFGRAFFGALQMMAGAMANASSFNMPSMTVEEYEQLPPMASLVTLTATAMLFISGAHADVFVAVAETYTVAPVGEGFAAQAAFEQYVGKLSAAMYLCLRITAPFMVYGIIINLSLGLTNRLMPQMPVYFVGLPAIVCGGLFLLWMTITEMVSLFFEGLGNWLSLV
ncbi:type III secretion protein [Rhodobacteraceae bacterium RKSG542]|nr:flagellar biosynthetic protein FliR [Pseudovibrio flavus]MTI16760.1 type III secretion protein [Pseudovibrio flavus]